MVSECKLMCVFEAGAAESGAALSVRDIRADRVVILRVTKRTALLQRFSARSIFICENWVASGQGSFRAAEAAREGTSA
jgi:hypothetical protein